MNEPLGILGTPHMGFFALLIIGGLAGWIASMITAAHHGIFTNILVGIAGSWIGSELASILKIAVRGSVMQLVMAVAGSVIIIYLWRMIHSDRSLIRR